MLVDQHPAADVNQGDVQTVAGDLGRETVYYAEPSTSVEDELPQRSLREGHVPLGELLDGEQRTRRRQVARAGRVG